MEHAKENPIKESKMEECTLEERSFEECAIVCGAPILDDEWLKAQLSRYCYIIAADSGFDHLKRIGRTPNLLMGDFDSLKSDLPKKCPIVRFSSHKDDTDYGICLRECQKEGFQRVAVFGAWGKRADHSFAAIAASYQALKGGLTVTIYNKDSTFYFVNRALSIRKTAAYVSVFPLGGGATVSLEGFEYPLSAAKLLPCDPLGVSNHVTEDFGNITVHSGTVLVIVQNDI